ncbi:MAG TPA: phytanoyl-CoA dioxygenase family protein [Terriglobales bacterium]|jgi:ectoine hydroxylase-related dioxygenase (phytanoyl-CoA dioxygenase family)|nr:phytanoyl-CoA dioxygenase family protein [Terriglobales bacterium]
MQPGSIVEEVTRNGFTIIPSVFTTTESENVAKLISGSSLSRGRAGIRHVLANPDVAAVARSPQLAEIASAILGGGATPFCATFFDKSPTSNWLVAWHQDTALPLRAKHDLPGWGPWSVKDGIAYAHAPTSALTKVVALRVHLDDSTEMNGPLRVLPGTHDSGILSDDEVHDLSLRMPSVDCSVPRGGILAMRPLLIHSSSKSQVEAARRVLHIEYAASLKISPGVELAIA